MIYSYKNKENHKELIIGNTYLFSDALQEEKNYKVVWREGVLDKIETHPYSANCFVSDNQFFLYCKDVEND